MLHILLLPDSKPPALPKPGTRETPGRAAGKRPDGQAILTSDQFRAGMGPDTRRQVCNPRRLLPEDFTDDLVYTFGSILLPDGLIYVCLVNGS